ncbi:homeobox-leucine zipper protein ATHB-54 [Tripterygium wilfordii]|uniref:Homeobox-leucine zipper protein n=1 Tax=Tripterygium wilfordii TaxID=458696 RepID=A0A7J7D3T8_TRIWF|nr:homeobox-leucine zipper protein HAT5-like [Tripterygium wilfordii]KAF5741015.1 homeobox-leucine zipper protein ATHB-54 [Tripterygium wilfordii]
MASDTVSAGSNFIVLLQSDRLAASSSSSEALDSIWIPTCSTVHGPSSMVNFDNVGGGGTMDNPDEELDMHNNQQPGKKRRLSATQVQFLERNFDLENKLEPERKLQLAKELGLQPRQVAIWFQNRRARYKNKQLEKDFDSLKSCYDKLKVDCDNLLKEKEILTQEVIALKEKLVDRERGKENLEFQDAIEAAKNAEPEKPAVPNSSESNVVAMVVCKQEDASSARSDVFDSDSPHYTNGNHSSLLEPEQSDFSQEEEDHHLDRSFLQVLPCFPKLEDGCYNDPPVNSSSFEFPVEDQPFWTWSY